MQISKRAFQLLLVMSLALVIAACSGGDSGSSSAPEPSTDDTSSETVDDSSSESSEDTDTESADTESADSEDTETADEDSGEDSSEDSSSSSSGSVATGDQRVLAWVAPGDRPGNQSAAGELVYFNSDGSTETVLSLPQATTRVTECGPGGTSPDGATIALIVTVTAGGQETGTIYLARAGESDLTSVDDGLNPISCTGTTPFQFSPDGSRFAYIDWTSGASTETSPSGTLRVYETASASQVASFDNVNSFVLSDDGAIFISFFVNGDGEATEVAISDWDGNVDNEVATLSSDEENDCFYTSASLEEVTSGFVSIMGYLCNRGDNRSTQWQFYTIDPDSQTAQLELTQDAVGRYFVFSQTNAIYASPDGSDVFFTVPDGIDRQTVTVYTTGVDTIDPQQRIDRAVRMPVVSDLPYDANNATTRVSPDGRFIAMVVNTPDNDATLNVFDLNDPMLPAISLDAGDRGDTIGSMVFNDDSSKLYYVAGADEGENNSVFVLDLETGTETRIRRGRYAQIAVSADETSLVAMNWVEFDAEEPRYLSLEIIDLESTAPTTIYEGGEVNSEGELENQSFAYPLFWH